MRITSLSDNAQDERGERRRFAVWHDTVTLFIVKNGMSLTFCSSKLIAARLTTFLINFIDSGKPFDVNYTITPRDYAVCKCNALFQAKILHM